MSNPTLEELTGPEFASAVESLPLDELRRRRTACQDAEEALSLQRRLVQGRLDIVQADLYRRSGGSDDEVANLVASLPDILVEHGDRHLGPGRLTSVESGSIALGADFEKLVDRLDEIVDGAKLSSLDSYDESDVRRIADELDELERGISVKRHQLHKHIDRFQEEVVRRYKTGEASVEGLLGS